MKWMVIIGLACGLIGGLYRWRVPPADPEKWGLMDVLVAMIAIGGVVFFAVGLVLLGLKEIF